LPMLFVHVEQRVQLGQVIYDFHLLDPLIDVIADGGPFDDVPGQRCQHSHSPFENVSDVVEKTVGAVILRDGIGE
jgi:hypothetical protein